MEEADYLAMVSSVQDRLWPKDLPRAPQYPLGEVLLTDHLRHWAQV